MKLIFTAFSLMIFISAANADNMALFEANKKSILTAFSIAGPQSKLSKSESKFAYKFKHTAERQVQGEKWVLRDLESKYRKCGSLEKMSPKDAVKYEELVRTSLKKAPEKNLKHFIEIGKKLLPKQSASLQVKAEEKQPLAESNESKVDNEKNKPLKPSASSQKQAELDLQKGKEYYKKNDKKKAFIYIRKSAEGDNNEAQYMLARAYFYGWGTPKDIKKTIHWYETSAKNGNKYALNTLGWAYSQGGGGILKDYKKAFKYYKKSAEQGNASGQFHLALAYENGNGTLKDYKKAFKYMKMSADQGNAAAQEVLGMMYYGGRGVLKNNEKTLYWLKKSAEQDYTMAQMDLGEIYIKNKNLKDYKKAKYWINKAYENGSLSAKTYWNRYELWKY